MINVTKSFLPPLEEYTRYLQGIWERGHLTNHGPLVLELEARLREILGVKHFFFLNNGTIALQIAIKALDLHGDIITTPFSYVATTSSIVWENARPVFVDIREEDLTLDPDLIESAITPDTTAILATHVYGIPCQVDAIAAIAAKHGLKVIYDAAHAYGVTHGGKGVMNFGDISTISFHATKLFHTVEGGGVATNDDELAHRISYLRNFGHNGQEAFWGLGVNGKNSEFHAAMGLCMLPHMHDILADRRMQSETYDSMLLKQGDPKIKRPQVATGTSYNYSYYPVLFQQESTLVKVREALNAAEIFPRRYFYPALHQLPYIDRTYSLPVTELASRTVLCLPLYAGLSREDVCRISDLVMNAITNG